ncbi:hypothetical protein TNIN_389801 [Trichonephila inaurata madagascariensis]|uniref:Uncharacterized protein n=1 Tax=Trichonephila inaurata madagascariensis TaxID=2747483 RepID=A0A8X7BPZ1_9ARAC|nr:hypothetical protein TNIN_389801 [Trichonephila inaurata madagascariensis]
MQCINSLDMELYDILRTVPNTVEIKVLSIEMFILHLSGGTKVDIKLTEATVLTSMSNDSNKLGVAREAKLQEILIAKKTELYGIICSIQDQKEPPTRQQ